MTDFIDGWSLVDVGGMVMLQLVAPSSTDGQLLVNRWTTEWRAFGFGELPIAVDYVGPSYFRATDGSRREYRMPTDRPSATVTIITVARDLRRGGATAEWRWDSCTGFWERRYRDGWRRMPRIVEAPQ